MRRTMQSIDDGSPGLPRTPGVDIVAFVLLTAGIVWVLVALVASAASTPTVGALGGFAPAIAALVVVGVRGRRRGLAALLGRMGLRSVPRRALAEAVVVPFGVAAFLALVAAAFGIPGARTLATPSPLLLLVVLLAAGEELGWRGFLLPALLGRSRPLPATMAAGAIHAAWHLPWFVVPGQLFAGVPFGPYAVFLMGLATVFTWLHLRSRGSVLVATLLHAAVNASGFLYGGIAAPDVAVLTAAGYGFLALWLIATAPALHLGRPALAPLPR